MYEVITLYCLILHNVIRWLYLKKTGKKRLSFKTMNPRPRIVTGKHKYYQICINKWINPLSWWQEARTYQATRLWTYVHLAYRGCVLCLVTQLCPTRCDPMDCSPPGSSVHGDSPGKNTGVGCHTFFQGIFPTQGTNPGLPPCRQVLYHLNPQGSPYTQGTFMISISTLFENTGYDPLSQVTWWVGASVSHCGKLYLEG